MRWPTIICPAGASWGREHERGPRGIQAPRPGGPSESDARYTRSMRPAFVVLAAVLAAAPAARPVDPDYVQEVGGWRAKREEGLRAADGWLAVVGLHWLREGTSTIGSAKGSDVLLP